jgi:hypothetical protein
MGFPNNIIDIKYTLKPIGLKGVNTYYVQEAKVKYN